MEDGTRQDAVSRLRASHAGLPPVGGDPGDSGEDAFGRLEACGRPFLVTDVIGADFRTWWQAEVLEAFAAEPIYFIEGDGVTGSRTLLQGTFAVFANECKRLSGRQRYAYLQTDALPMICPALTAKLVQNLPKSVPTGGQNLFANWPKGLCPAQLSLTVAGAGARSQLRFDDLKATQWLLCLSGHMRMKLLPDDDERLQPLEAVKRPFGIRDEQGLPMFDVCSHSTSAMDLFAAQFIEQEPVSHLDAFGPDLKRWPEARSLPRAMEVLVTAGELLVIPGGWWMQSYFDEHAWVAGSQYLSSNNLPAVLEAVLTHTGVRPDSIFALDRMPPQQRIDAVLAAALAARSGRDTSRGDGQAILAKLRMLDTAADQGILAGGQCAATSGRELLCEVCGRRAAMQCGRCKGLWLCGVECQRRSWPDHREVCARRR